MTENDTRTLDITDLERIDRFRRAGYGGSVSDALPPTPSEAPHLR